MREIKIYKKRNEKENAKKFVFVFHHDVDGLTSGAGVTRALGLGNFENVLFVPHDPNEEFPEIVATEVYIVDIAITPKTWGSLQNIKAEKVLWIDHHKPFQELSALNLPANVQVILDPSSPSAVMLVQKYFGLDDEISKKIVELGTKADTWMLDPLVEEWMNLDMAYTYKKKDKTILIEKIATGNLEISGRLKRTLESYLRMKEKAKKKLLEYTLIKNVHGHHLVAVGLAPALLSGSEGADFILKETNTEVQIVLKYQGWMSIRRRKDSTVNLLDIAQIFGGGGHEYAAGGSLGKHVNSRNLLKVAMEIFEEISLVI